MALCPHDCDFVQEEKFQCSDQRVDIFRRIPLNHDNHVAVDEYRRNDQYERLLRLIVREPEDTRGTQHAILASRIWISLPEHNVVR